MSSPSAAILLLLALVASVHAFTAPNTAKRSKNAATTSLFMSETATARTTLTDETTWRLRLLLNDVTSSKGAKLDGKLFVIEGSFIEEEGYEPPQGTFVANERRSSSGEDLSESDTTILKVKSSRWKLSEDPDDPKDGLWIWGLFKEPLYPFMLLQIETEKLTLPSGIDEEADSIPPLKLFAQINHARKEDVGVELQAANLNVRILEQIQLPGASVDLYEEEPVGQISFQPLL
ncbi:hypothetical protein THAOC_27162 [Thalassiosira oceanica]|uniref:Uncharacterized protein n=1 Tax=Thalassiosira oceanica TaxID=159749 RepID=K0RX23_THAOC|nr:hypothetical protein THAOC_27162 [Thalassiosira oceanica]|eukprot:EJK53411.1 hypothetical protein THAOC_27162 [Thalassiosira oceanica]